jgi:hypothetical protein
MNKILNILITFMLLIQSCSERHSSSDVHVNGYRKSNGTYVALHYRTAPNNTKNDNYSTRGNVNPYNGKIGYVSPDNQRYNDNVNYHSSDNSDNNTYSSSNSTTSFTNPTVIHLSKREEEELWDRVNHNFRVMSGYDRMSVKERKKLDAFLKEADRRRQLNGH